MYRVACDIDDDINVLYSGEADYAKGWTIRGSEAGKDGRIFTSKIFRPTLRSTQLSILAIPGPFPRD
jgi:hypothetical protein